LRGNGATQKSVGLGYWSLVLGSWFLVLGFIAIAIAIAIATVLAAASTCRAVNEGQKPCQ
jgi:hypothetical protein